MAWSWSHAPEAYEKGRENVSKQTASWLKVCLAEIRSREPSHDHDSNEPGENTFGWELNMEKYEEEMAKLHTWWREQRKYLRPKEVKEMMADEIWEFAEQYRTCDNGGYNLHCCPWGCHVADI